MTDTRYPYTYADDLIRGVAGYTSGGTKLSRSDASQIIKMVAAAMSLEPRTVCEKLADYHLQHKEALAARAVERFIAARSEQ
jgi:hypothetical protein